MRLDRLDADAQALRDIAVGEIPDEQLEDLPLARGEIVEQSFWLGGGLATAERRRDSRGRDPGREVASRLAHRAYGLDDLVGGLMLEGIAVGPRREGAADVVARVVHRE